MRIKSVFITALFFLVLSLAGKGRTEVNQEDFSKAVGEIKKGITTQYSTQAGKNGIKIICTLIPSQMAAAVVWEISNPENKTLVIKPEDISLYSSSRKFKRISPDQAIEARFNWSDDSNTSSSRQEGREDLRGSPGQDSREMLMRNAAFNFGASSESIINGVTYFNCRLRVLDGVTAEIKVDNEVFKFSFEGGKSPQ